MRDWIVINGRRVIWEDFIGILDYYRYKGMIRGKGREVRNQYNYMIYVIQELACDYHEGSDYVLDNEEDFIRRHYMRMPKERRLPEALEELFNQMQTRLCIENVGFFNRHLTIKSKRAWRHGCTSTCRNCWTSAWRIQGRPISICRMPSGGKARGPL